MRYNQYHVSVNICGPCIFPVILNPRRRTSIFFKQTLSQFDHSIRTQMLANCLSRHKQFWSSPLRATFKLSNSSTRLRHKVQTSLVMMMMTPYKAPPNKRGIHLPIDSNQPPPPPSVGDNKEPLGNMLLWNRSSQFRRAGSAGRAGPQRGARHNVQA